MACGQMLGGGAQRHGGVDAELARFVRGGRNHAALVALSANDHRFAFQRGIEEFFHGDEEGVHIDVEDGAEKRGIGDGGHAWGNFSSRGGRGFVGCNAEDS